MKLSTAIYLGVILIIPVTLIFLVPFENEIAKEFLSLPISGVLIAALFTIFRDEMAHQGEIERQKNEHLFTLGITSDSVKIIFKKHIEFCEEYLAKFYEFLENCLSSIPKEKLNIYARNLANLRIKYAPWITQEMSTKLEPFESVIREFDYIEHSFNYINDPEARRKNIEKQFEIYNLLVGYKSPDETKSALSHMRLQHEIRSILQLDKFLEIRDIILDEAYIEAQNLKSEK